MTPSLPTFSIASANRSPISVSLLLATVPTWAISFLLLMVIDIFLSFSVMSATAFSMPCFMCIGLTPATTAFSPSLKIDSAITVAVVVPSPATSLVFEATSRTMPGAHVFVDVFQVDFLGDRHAVFGHRRRAEALLQNHVAALGAERHLDRPGQLGNAAAHRVAGFLVECNHLGHSRDSPEWICMVVGTLPRAVTDV